MIAWILRKFGYYRIDYGFSMGRHWMSIDGKIIAQSHGDDVWMRDEDIRRLIYIAVDHGKHWSAPDGRTDSEQSSIDLINSENREAP